MDQILKISGVIFWIFLFFWMFNRYLLSSKWKRKIFSSLVLGPRLVDSSKKLVLELPDRVKKETLAEVATYVFLRLTRIGLIGLSLALIPLILLWIQNNKISHQNSLIQNQNYLIESQRRSSLVLLMNNVFSDLTEEINTLRENSTGEFMQSLDSVGYKLSDPLIGRIASLSQGLLPYRFIEDGELTNKEYSIERGQLLLALINSNLSKETYDEIYKATKFQNAYLVGANLIGKYLKGIDLSNSKINDSNLEASNLSNSNLFEVDLERSNLSQSNLDSASLFRANLRLTNCRNTQIRGSELSQANLERSGLFYVNFNGSRLETTNLYRAEIHHSDLSNVSLSDANFLETSLMNVNFNGAKYLDKREIKKAYNLHKCINLEPDLESYLKNQKPCLFNFTGCD